MKAATGRMPSSRLMGENPTSGAAAWANPSAAAAPRMIDHHCFVSFPAEV
jgi:hypothetical protein